MGVFDRFRLDDIRQPAHGFDQLRGERLIDFDESDRVLARGSASEMKCRDVDLRRAQTRNRRARCSASKRPALFVVRRCLNVER